VFQIEAGKMKLIIESIRTPDLIGEVSEVISPLLNQKKSITYSTNIAIDTPEEFMGDHMKIKQILVNLLSNAVKFTSSGSIELKVTMTGPQKIFEPSSNNHYMTKTWTSNECQKFIKFSVKDTGTGIDGKDFEKIFSAFEQVVVTFRNISI
jgi:signal transduction histidine kinase